MFKTAFYKSVLYRQIAFIFMLVAITPALMADGNFQPVFKPTLTVNRTAGGIHIDGRLDEPAWQQAVRVTQFAETSPGDNLAPGVETEAYITYDNDNLYVAFNCYDDPATIRATMCQRDQFYNNDDQVSLYLDTYGDAVWGYEFTVNPYGIQKDFLWTSVQGEDRSFDLVWAAAARIVSTGYQVEMAIPFSALRFQDKDIQKWRIDLGRVRPRETFYNYNWAARDRNESCIPCQFGAVEGITNVHPGKGFEIMPTVVAFQNGAINYDTSSLPFDNNDPDGELSVGAKYSISSDITAEATFNPDFSQIEADAAQIDVNSTISLFYPERRPFFNEGSDIFRTLFNSFYTRTINDPIYAAKVTGRADGLRFGFMSAGDNNSPYMIPLEAASVIVNTGKSYANVLRAAQSLGNSSHIGIAVNDLRNESGGANTILGIDGNFRLSRNYFIDGQFVFSHTVEPDNPHYNEGIHPYYGTQTFDEGKHTVYLDGETYDGTGLIARFRRGARHWNFMIDYNQTTPSYRTETGFDPYNNYRNFSVFTNYVWNFNKGFVQRYALRVNTYNRWNFDDRRTLEVLSFGTNLQSRFMQSGIDLNYQMNSEVYNNVLFENLWDFNMIYNISPSDLIGLYLGFERSLGVARRYMARGIQTSLSVGMNLKPIDRLTVESNFDFARSVDEETKFRHYNGYIVRTRLLYQATKELSGRLVVQYNDFGPRWEVDPLITYRINPFSLVYIGSTYDYDEFINPDETGKWKLSSRQFFLKLQYLFQV